MPNNLWEYTKLTRIGFIILLTLVFSLGNFFNVTFAIDNNEKEIKDKLQTILSSSEFKNEKENLFSESFWDAIEKFFNKFNFEWDDKKNSNNSNFSSVVQITKIIFIFSIIIIIIIGIIYFIFKSRFKIKQKVQIDANDEEILEHFSDYKLLQLKSEELFEKGEYRQAIRYLYLSLLIKLDDESIIMIDKAKTNKQYLKEVCKNKVEIAERVDLFTTYFNNLWYGKEKNIIEDFTKWKSTYYSVIKESLNE